VRCGIIGAYYLEVDSGREGSVCADDVRITVHNASWDYEGSEPRHGTRVTSLAEKPYFDPKAKTRREALGLLGSDEIEELERLNLTQ
jgi:hypothetical protein